MSCGCRAQTCGNAGARLPGTAWGHSEPHGRSRAHWCCRGSRSARRSGRSCRRWPLRRSSARLRGRSAGRGSRQSNWPLSCWGCSPGWWLLGCGLLRSRWLCRRWLLRCRSYCWFRRSRRMRHCNRARSSGRCAGRCRTGRSRRTGRNDCWPGRTCSRRTRCCGGPRCGASCRSKGPRPGGRRGGWLRRSWGSRARGFRSGRSRFCRLSRRFLSRQLLEMLPDKFRVCEIERTGVRLLFRDADLRQVLDQDFGLNLEFPGQFIDSYLIRV